MTGYRKSIAIWAIALALTGCGGGEGAQPAVSAPVAVVDATPTPVPSPVPSPTPVASSAAAKPLTGPLNVLFLGGSVTRGAGASTIDKSFPRLVAAWLQTTVGTVNAWNIAVGATTSEFATYRLERDMGAFKPDIAIIDFAINDPPGDKGHAYAFNDALVYKLRQINPRIRIVFAAVTSLKEEATRRAGARDPRTNWLQEIGEKDGSVFVDAGADIWRQTIAGQHAAGDFFADELHPNDLGHATYALAIENALSKIVASGASDPVTGSVYISQTRLDTAKMLDRDAVVTNTSCSTTSLTRLDGWQQQVSYYSKALKCAAGDTFAASFSGTTIGLINLNTPDGGNLECQVDGGAKAVLSQPANVGTNSWVQFAFRDLKEGNHVMACTAQGPFTIGEFLISSAHTLNP